MFIFLQISTISISQILAKNTMFLQNSLLMSIDTSATVTFNTIRGTNITSGIYGAFAFTNVDSLKVTTLQQYSPSNPSSTYLFSVSNAGTVQLDNLLVVDAQLASSLYGFIDTHTIKFKTLNFYQTNAFRP